MTHDLKHFRPYNRPAQGAAHRAVRMNEEASRHILCAASFIDVQSIDGGDTVVMRFRKTDEQEFVILVPRQVALILQPRVSAVLAQQHDPRRYGP